MAEPGIHIHRASRMEWLAQRLHEAVLAEWPDPLHAPLVVVGHPGLKTWLRRYLAALPGPRGERGICAHWRLLLPGEWLGERLQALCPELSPPAQLPLTADGAPDLDALLSTQAGDPWSREALSWRIHAGLGLLDEPALRRYLSADRDGRRRVQLARRLADLYSRYLVYRPDWIAAWEAAEPPSHPGRGTPTADDWQARLWRALATDAAAAGGAHRAQAVAQALDRLRLQRDARALPPPGAPALHVYASQHLPPDALELALAESIHMPVHLYFAEPCRELWEDLVSERELALAGASAEWRHLDVGHPLLSVLGRLGQQHSRRLLELDALHDERDPADESEAKPVTLLGALQDSLRRLQPQLITDHLSAHGADPSLRIVDAHTPLRELEILKDAIYDALAADPQLRLHDIVVMSAQLATHAALLPAVFGAPADRDAALPYRISDGAEPAHEGLLALLGAVLDLPLRRWTRSEFLEWLRLPALARALDLDAEAQARIAAWCEPGAFAYALDEQPDPASGMLGSTHSLRQSVDRLLAGSLLGDAEPGILDELLAVPVGHADQDLLGRLDRLLEWMRRWRLEARGERSLADWCLRLEWQFSELLSAEQLASPAWPEALQTIRAPIRAAQAAALNPRLGYAAVRECWDGAIAEARSEAPWLSGAISVCGLVPQRAVPFKMVAILGLDSSAFPRQGEDVELDRMREAPRRGDRNLRDDDRYLFLEALLAARQRLHLSFCGRDAATGKPRAPASPLGLLLDVLARHGGNRAAEYHERHPLQPFDRRYFEAPRRALASWQRAYAEALCSAPAEPEAFFDGPLVAPGVPLAAPERMSSAEIFRFWRAPLSAQLKARLGIHLPRRAAHPADEEPLDADWTLGPADAARVLEQVLRSGGRLPDLPPRWLRLSGRLAEGALGVEAWQAAAARLQPMIESWQRLAPDLYPSQMRAHAVRLRCLDSWIEGSVPSVSLRNEILWLWRFQLQPLDWRARLRTLLEIALLRLSAPTREIKLVQWAPAVKHGELARDTAFEAWSRLPPEALRSRLIRLLEWQWASREALLWLPLRCAESWHDAREKGPSDQLRKVRQTWMGDEKNLGEAHYDDGVGALLARDRDWLRLDAAEYQQMGWLATEIGRLLDLEFAKATL